MAASRGQSQVDFLKSVVANGGRIVGARFSLQRETLKAAEPYYWLTLEQHGARSLQELQWTSELEEYFLFEAPQKMDTRDDEIQRFAVILLNNLRTAESVYGGRDFAHSVLVDVLRQRGEFGLQSLLERTGAAAPSRGSRYYLDCAAFLQHSIDGLRNTASVALGYKNDEGVELMRSALEIVLDEVFHISTADALFPRK